MYRKFALSMLCLMLLAGSAMAQETAVVFELKGIGVDAQTLEAATHILRNELNATGKFTVIAKEKVEAALSEKHITDFTCHDVACASEFGYIAGAEKAIIGSLTKLGNKITAEIRVVSVVKKEVLFTDRFSCTSIDDLDVTLRKLAEAAASGRKIESEVTRYAITEEETLDSRRKKSYITSGVSFGFGIPLGDSYSGVDHLTSVAWMMRYEAGNWVIENSIGVTWGGGGAKITIDDEITDEREVTVVPWDIGMRYVFNRESDFTPFLAGGLGLHFIGSQEYKDAQISDNDQAFAFHLAGGMYGFQSYDFRLAVEAKYTIVFSDVFIDSGNSSHQFGISIGVSRKLEKGEKRGCMSGGCLF